MEYKNAAIKLKSLCDDRKRQCIELTTDRDKLSDQLKQTQTNLSQIQLKYDNAKKAFAKLSREYSSLRSSIQKAVKQPDHSLFSQSAASASHPVSGRRGLPPTSSHFPMFSVERSFLSSAERSRSSRRIDIRDGTVSFL